MARGSACLAADMQARTDEPYVGVARRPPSPFFETPLKRLSSRHSLCCRPQPTALWLVGKLTATTCTGSSGADAGSADCTTTSDGYYPTAAVFTVLGFVWMFAMSSVVRVASRSIPPQWESIRFRPLICTYAPWGVRVDGLAKSRKIPTWKNKFTSLFREQVLRLRDAPLESWKVANPAGASAGKKTE